MWPGGSVAFGASLAVAAAESQTASEAVVPRAQQYSRTPSCLRYTDLEIQTLRSKPMAFQAIRHQAPPAESPEAHYRDLPRGPGAVSGLWVHQGDLLRIYAHKHLNTADLALELPTGTGKTLPGLILLDWVRLKRRACVVYACPTVQLTRQVAEVAEREGIPHALLTGRNQLWDPSDKRSYETAEAMGS